MEVFLNIPPLQEMRNSTSIVFIQQHQFMDERPNQCHQTQPMKYPTKFIQNRPLLCYWKRIDDPEGALKIAIPTAIINQIISWYHEVLGHCGTHRLYDTICQHFYYPNLRMLCDEYNHAVCAKNKLLGAGYRHFPSRHANLIPWEDVIANLIGPWKVKINEQEIFFNALTCIDPVTNLVEMIRIDSKTSRHNRQQFENCWLNRYPHPNKYIHDKGREFIGWEFQEILETTNIIDSPTISRNPLANSICEHLHQTVANILRTKVRAQPSQNVQQAEQIVDNCISSTGSIVWSFTF